MRRAVVVMVVAATLMAAGPAGVGAFPSTYPAGPGSGTATPAAWPTSDSRGGSTASGCGAASTTTPPSERRWRSATSTATGTATWPSGLPGSWDAAAGCSDRCDGAVYVISADQYGLAPSAARRWTATGAGIGYTFQDWFGASLAAGDFTGDRRDDLAIGLPFADRGAEDGGAVRVLRGSANGLTATGGMTLDQNWAGGNHIEDGDRFGGVLLAANVAGDAQADLVVGVPYEDLGDRWDAGAVDVIFGGAGMLSGRGQRFTQAAIGLAIEHGDQFGLVAN